MKFEQWLTQNSNVIRRCKHLGCGWVLEAIDVHDNADKWKKDFLKSIHNNVEQESFDLIYSLHLYKSDGDRFDIDGTLKRVPSEVRYGINTSTLSAGDIFGKFTQFDFDLLTLSEPGEQIDVEFTANNIESLELITKYKELDLQGLQFEVTGLIESKNKSFKIRASAAFS